MQEIIQFIYQTDSLAGLIISILVGLMGIFGSLLLIFWWQANSVFFSTADKLIDEGRYYQGKDDEKYCKIKSKATELLSRLKKIQKWTDYLTVPTILLIILIMIISLILLVIKIVVVHCFKHFDFSFFPFSVKSYYTILFAIMTNISFIVICIIILLIFLNSVLRIRHLLPIKIQSLEIAFDIKENEYKHKVGWLYKVLEWLKTRRWIMLKLSPKQALYIGAMGAISFVLAFVLGSVVNAITGIPLTGGILNGVVVGAMITIGIKGVDKFGAATLIWFVFTIFAIPTITFGPPGWYKVIVGIISGFVWDLVISLFKRSKFGYIFSAGVGASAITYGVFIAAKMLGLPAAERLAKFLYFLIPMNFVISCIGAVVGLWLFTRHMLRMPFIQNLKE